MNESKIVFLINDDVRAVKACYEPDGKSDYFKTFDDSVAVDDLVIVETNTRHGMTVVKVTEIDAEVNLESSENVRWIVGKVDFDHHERLISQEKEAIAAVHSAERARKKRELKEALFADAQDKIETLAIAKAASEEVVE